MGFLFNSNQPQTMNDGAKYYKCDFQVHSPRDIQFVGQEYVTEEERKQYSKNFIKACREKNINAVAITDHHDLCFYPFIKEASQTETYPDGNPLEEYKRVVIFPGMELTLDVPCQALLLFDSTLDLTEDLMIVIYTTLLIQNQNPKTASKCVAHARLPFKSINQIYDKLNTVASLRNRFIVFPNIKENGSDSILRTGFYNEYANGQFVGGYLDRGQYESHQTKVGWNNIINGKVDAYGFRSIGVFQTSDNRTDTFEHLGVSASWVKWSVPTSEALRQVCLAKKSRILQEEPKFPLTRISRIAITNSSFLKNFSIEFNPQFNVCIGGRGTGKSSILQYISWALGKDSETEKRSDLENFVQNTLKDGKVELDVFKNGILHSIMRNLNEYKIKIGEENWQETNSQNVTSIIKADSFAQKELSKHEKNRTTQLTKIIENTVDSGVESIRRKLEENGNKIKEVAVLFEAYLYNRRTSANLKNQIDSIEEQIKSLNNQLKDIPEGDQETIRSNNLVANEKDLIKKSESQINSLTDQIQTVLTKGNFNPITIDEKNILNKEEFNSLISSHDEIVDNIKTELNNALTKITSGAFEKSKAALKELHQNHDLAYTEAKARQSKFEQIIKEIEELRMQLGVLTEDRQRLNETIENQQSSIKQLKILFFERHKLNLTLHSLIKSAVSEVVNKSESSLEIKITSLENIDFITNKFMASVTGSKGQPERTTNFFKKLLRGDNTYKQLLKFWLSIFISQNGPKQK